MACASCGSNKNKSVPLIELSASPRVEGYSLTSIHGNRVEFPALLISSRPQTGWDLNVKINGVGILARGSQPDDVIRSYHKLTNDNGIETSLERAWLSCNLVWMQNSPSKMRRVSIEDVEAALGGLATQLVKERILGYSPKEWGSVAWKFLGLLLVTEFDSEFFLQTMRRILGMMNPDDQPLTGCAECYDHFKPELAAYEAKPPVTLEEARVWLWAFHNRVNARKNFPMLTFPQAAKQNKWDLLK